MAGLYPDAPAPKMFYESDGSALFYGATEETSLANKKLVNDETMGGPVIGSAAPRIIFPELRDILGIAFQHGSISASFGVETSPNTTNGTDGTWTSRATNIAGALNVIQPHRNAVRTGLTGMPWTGVKGIRPTQNAMGGDTTLWFLNVYGYPTTNTGLNRLLFWNPTTDIELVTASLDFGDVARGATVTKQFRIKNNSTTLTANSIVISEDELTAPSPTIVSQTTFDNAGSGYAATQNIGNLAPGGISGIITQRIILSSTAQILPWRQRVMAVAGSWV